MTDNSSGPSSGRGDLGIHEGLGHLAGRVAIITGASRGIGQAIAKAFAEEGAAIVASGRRQESLDAVAESINASGGRATALAAHAGESGSAQALVEFALDAFGRIDILVNNAGTCPHFGPILSADDGLWDKTMDVNLRGPFRMAAACAPAMRSGGGGSIVNIASIAGLIPQPNVGLYCLSKAALVMLTQVLAAELAADGIRVNAVAPGFIQTRFSRAVWEDTDRTDETLRLIPQRRFGEAEEVARAVVYLAGGGAGFTTGTTIVVDGGQMVSAGLDA